MKFYVDITCHRRIELETEDYESAMLAADQQVSALLPERDQWHPKIEVSAIGPHSGDDRYYVHRQSPHGFLVRERQLAYQNATENPGTHPTDPIIRHFQGRDDAYHYARTMNEVQRELDKRYGRWARHAVTPQDAGSEEIAL
jgi:hypothetical protein